MESRRKRRRSQLYKWGLYALLLLGCTVLQTVPGFLLIGQARPVFLLPLALAVAVCEDEFSGALFGAVCGLMWDYTAGRTAGLLALTVMGLSFAVSVASQMSPPSSHTAERTILLERPSAVLMTSNRAVSPSK